MLTTGTSTTLTGDIAEDIIEETVVRLQQYEKSDQLSCIYERESKGKGCCGCKSDHGCCGQIIFGC